MYPGPIKIQICRQVAAYIFLLSSMKSVEEDLFILAHLAIKEDVVLWKIHQERHKKTESLIAFDTNY